MSIDRISRYQPTYQPEWPSEENLQPVLKKQPGWDGVDRFTSSAQNYELVPPQISNLKGSNEEKIKIAAAHAKLLEIQHLLGNVLEATNDKDEVDFNLLDQRSRETLLEGFMVECRKAQVSNVEENTVLLNKFIEEDQAQTKEIRKLYFNAVDDQINNAAEHKKLETASTILTALSLGGGILALVASITTGNIPAALIILNGVVAISSGAVNITQATKEKEAKELVSLLLELTTKRELLSQKISKEKMRELKSKLDAWLEIFSQQRTIQDHRMEAAKWQK